MKINRWTGLAVAVLSWMAGPVWAGTEERLGTGGAPELRLPVGARSIALAGANLGSIAGPEALFYNPAGIAGTEAGTQVLFSNTAYIADMDVNFVGVSQRMGDWGVLGLSVKVLSVGDIIFTSESAPDGTGEVFSPTFSTMGLTYARQMTDRVNFGGTIYYVAERILQETAAGVAFDFGFQYDTGYRGARLGMTMKNFGPNLSYNGADFETNLRPPDSDPQSGNRTFSSGSSHFELPSYFQLGMSLPLVQGQTSLTAHGLYSSNSYDVDDGRVGLELGWRQDGALRLGYKFSGNDDDLFGLSYGAGLRVPVGGSAMWLDYAGQTVSDFFDDIHHVSLSLNF